MRRVRWLAIVAFVGIAGVARADDGTSAAPPQRGQDQQAREQSRAAFRRGVTAAEQGRYDVAREAFREAYARFAHPSILLNLGIACWKTGEYLEAEDDLVKFLADDGGARADEIASAHAALAAARSHLGAVRLHVAPDGARATIDARPIALVPGGSVDVRAVEGDHAIRVDADGYEAASETVHVAAGRATPLAITLRALEHPGDGRAIDATATTTTSASRRPRTVGIVLVGSGVALAALGTFAGLRALDLSHAYDDRADARFQQPDVKSEGIAWRTAADVSFGLAIVGVGIGAWLLLAPPREPPPREPPQASLVVGPGFARGTF